MAYAAIVTNIQTRPHPNADRLKLGTVCGHQVVVGLDVENGALGVFFPCDGQLNHEFCVANDEYPRYVDDDGKKKRCGGFIDPKNRRVRAQSFRGEKSDGYWVPMSKLYFLGDHVFKQGSKDWYNFGETIKNLVPGDQFTELAGIPICNKYVTEKTRKAQQAAQGQAKIRKDTPTFARHIDTKQFRYELDNIPIGSVIWISEKLHGTSGRYGHVPVEVEPLTGWRGWIQRKLQKWFPRKELEFKCVMGSRRVELTDRSEGYYGSVDFRTEILHKLAGNLLEGEVIYGEIVGWVGKDSPIMGRHSPKKTKDKAFIAKYGDEFVYTYGQINGDSEFFPYRITRVLPDGTVTELSEPQMRQRAAELGFRTCPQVAGPLVLVAHSPLSGPVISGHEGNFVSSDKLQNVVDRHVDGPSIVDERHPREGIIIRIDRPDGTSYWLKDKNHPFKVMEGIAKDSGEADMEEAS